MAQKLGWFFAAVLATCLTLHPTAKPPAQQAVATPLQQLYTEPQRLPADFDPTTQVYIAKENRIFNESGSQCVQLGEETLALFPIYCVAIR